MVAVKGHYRDGRVDLPSGFAGLRPCEVTVLFPDEAAPREQGADDPFVQAAGGWRGIVDCEELKKYIYEARRISTRPQVKL